MEYDCFYNGNILPSRNLKISINDLGLLRSYAVFDYLRTYNGVPFRTDDYLLRFKNSANLLNLRLEYSAKELKLAITALLEKQNKDIGLRLLLTGGFTSDSFSKGKPNFFILSEKLFEYPGEIFRKGVKLITNEFQRFLPRAKTTNYLNAIMHQQEKENAKAFEILYHQKGMISEASRNNFFLIKDGALITPRENILLGITRKVVLEIAKKNNIHTEVRKVFLTEIYEADEAFITGSSKGIIPVISIDKIKIGSGRVGKLTRELMTNFFDQTQEQSPD